MREGYLQIREDGRYGLYDTTGNYLTYFTSGDSIDLYIEDYGWISGRVEYNDDYNGYYFYNPEGRHRSLWNGLKVRCN